MAQSIFDTTQAQIVGALGAEICHVIKWWKPAVAVHRCPFCGLKMYHIISHVAECGERNREEK